MRTDEGTTLYMSRRYPHEEHVLTESGSSHSANSVARKCSPPQIVRGLLVRRETLHTDGYNDPEADHDEDGQQRTETFYHSDDISNEYQNSHISAETELNTEPDTDENNNEHGFRSITRHQS